MNYGPYIPLLSGKYKLKINLLIGEKRFDGELGFWDIFISEFNKVIIAGDIIYNEGFCLSIESDFEITSELNNSTVEVRTYSNGNANIHLTSMHIEQICNDYVQI